MTNHTCDCPEAGHYAIVIGANITMNCYTCAFQCYSCYGGLNSACTACTVGFYLANNTNFCLSNCPDGQYKHPQKQLCYLCDPLCSTCEGLSYNCTACHTNTARYLLESSCVLSCPNGYAWNNDTLTCDLCSYNTYSYLGTCVTVCPTMYEADNHNRSCIHLSETQYYYELRLEEVHVLSHGKLLQFVILCQDGLNGTA